MKKQVWIGLANVEPTPGNKILGDAKGAFVNALAWVSSDSEYRNAVQRALDDMGFIGREFEAVEPFSERAANTTVAETLRVLASEVETAHAIRFGSFHTFPAAG